MNPCQLLAKRPESLSEERNIMACWNQSVHQWNCAFWLTWLDPCTNPSLPLDAALVKFTLMLLLPSRAPGTCLWNQTGSPDLLLISFYDFLQWHSHSHPLSRNLSDNKIDVAIEILIVPKVTSLVPLRSCFYFPSGVRSKMGYLFEATVNMLDIQNHPY